MSGQVVVTQGKTVATGTDLTHELTKRQPAQLEVVRFVLVTSNHVANRSVELVVTTADGLELARFPAPAVQAASSTVVYTFAHGAGSVTSPDQSVSFPDAWWPPGALIKTQTTNLDTADQLSGFVLTLMLDLSGDYQ